MAIRFDRIEARGALNRTGGFLGGKPGAYTHSFNPAIGCAYAGGFCGAFCYARSFAEQLGGSGTWGRRVLIKENAPTLLARDLTRAARRPADHPLHVSKLAVFSASTTDPCAGPLLPLYRECLRVVADYPVRRWVLQTRSPAVVKLRDELLALAERVVISFTLETDDESLWASMPRGSPPIAARRRAVGVLSGWPTRLHLAVSPCLPLRDAAGFARWIDRQADDATVDTFCSGDGSSGARTARSTLPSLLAARGFDWRDESHARGLYAELRRLMGERAGWSAAGFARLAL